MSRLEALLRPQIDAASGDFAIAVSGGGDSMALLDLASRLAPGRVRAVTLDHGLRPEAAAEATMVADFCAARGLSHQTLVWRGWDGQGNLQAEARDARYRLIGAWAREAGLAEVWLGHSRDDVAETLLIRLGRAAGLDGLSRMAQIFEREGMRWRRPLLDAGREELRAHLRAADLTWAEDPSNADPAYLRVRARQALPSLADLGISAEALSRSAAALAQSRTLIEEVMSAEWSARAWLEGGDILLRLEGAGPEVSRRLIRSALSWIGGGGWPVRQSAMAALAEHLSRAPHHTLAGCLVTRTTEGVRIAREWRAVRDLVGDGCAPWDGRWVLEPPAEGKAEGLEVRALGEGIAACPDWRATGLPRRSLMAGPAVWKAEKLIAAPLAGLSAGWGAKLRPSFATHPFAH